MRTVLIGSDFMYDKSGNLKPIEINTAVGWDGVEKLEEIEAICKANRGYNELILIFSDKKRITLPYKIDLSVSVKSKITELLYK